jgi:hypothetical protein
MQSTMSGDAARERERFGGREGGREGERERGREGLNERERFQTCECMSVSE